MKTEDLNNKHLDFVCFRRLSFQYISEQQQGLIKLILIKTVPSNIEIILSLFILTNAEILRTDYGYFNRPIDHQMTTNDRL